MIVCDTNRCETSLNLICTRKLHITALTQRVGWRIHASVNKAKISSYSGLSPVLGQAIMWINDLTIRLWQTNLLKFEKVYKFLYKLHLERRQIGGIFVSFLMRQVRWITVCTVIVCYVYPIWMTLFPWMYVQGVQLCILCGKFTEDHEKWVDLMKQQSSP